MGEQMNQKLFKDESESWKDMFEVIRKTFNISIEELNKEKYRIIFEMIERWAYYDYLRREGLRQANNTNWDNFGTFWKGE